MRIGIIDLGTNSVRFDVYQIRSRTEYRRLHREKLMVRLGQGVFVNGKLDMSARDRTLRAFQSFKLTAKELQVSRIVAFGTSTLREASDGERFIEQLKNRTGIEVRVISGEEEARLIARGILGNMNCIKGVFGLLDIGGGSTEVSICRGSKVVFSASINLGVARIQQVFLKSSPPKLPLEPVRKFIRASIVSAIASQKWPRPKFILGSSGSVRALIKLTEKGKGTNSKLTRKQLRVLSREMENMTTTELLAMDGMDTKRVDMILAGCLLLEQILEVLRAKEVRETGYSLRDGILDEELRSLRTRSGSRLPIHQEDLLQCVRKFGANEGHARKVIEIASLLYHSLQALHRLPGRFRDYLIAAAALHDVGEAISSAHHNEHSAYIVRNMDFHHIELWESDLLAALCMHHSGGKPDKGNVTFWLNKKLRDAFLKLLAILRVADSLDRSHRSLLRVISIRKVRRVVRIRVSGSAAIQLEILRLEQKKELFERVFKCQLVVERV